MADTSWDVLSVTLASQPQWDVLRVDVTANLYVDPAWDVLTAGIVGRQSAQIIANSELPARPYEVVSLTASTVGPSTLSTWTWRVISGTVLLSPSGNTCTFVAPPCAANENGTTVRVGATGSGGGVTSAEAVFDVVILPHLFYIASATDLVPAPFYVEP
jgi:hypothetical protein